MPDPKPASNSIMFFKSALGVITGNLSSFVLKKATVSVLEMEDICFHTASVVPMPDIPTGPSSEKGSGSDTQQKVSGIKAMALAYRQMEMKPDQRVLITGHTDTTGSASINYPYSEKRARSIYNLLIGNKAQWAGDAQKEHTIEDYQQIIKYYHHVRGWPCDPGPVDGKWGPKTSAGVDAFFNALNTQYSYNPKLDSTGVKSSPTHKLPLNAWEAIYDLYETDIFSTLIGANYKPIEAQNAQSSIKFVNPEKPYLGCGESFPIDNFGKDKYRSQQNRRVEIIFYDKNELPVIPLACPTDQIKTHKEKECPVYNSLFYKREYLNPDDIHTCLYHLKFEYYDKVCNEVKHLPCGLILNAFKGGNKASIGVTPRNGVYELRIFNVPNGKREADVYFNFKTQNSWVYTKDKSTEPVIVSKWSEIDSSKPDTPITRADIEKLSFPEQIHFYDLPEDWDSRNWFCSHKTKTEVVDKLIKTITSITEPLRFNLDNIVLCSGLLDQNIKDQNKTGSPMNLDNNSHYALFFIDCITKENVSGTQKNMRIMKIYKPLTTSPNFTDFNFSENKIHDLPKDGYVRCVYFCNGFYDVTNRRSTASDSNFNFAKGHIIGSRLAVLNDPMVHHSELFSGSDATQISNAYLDKDCGNYELHYLDKCGVLDGKPLSYLFIYWSCRFKNDPVLNNHGVTTIGAGTAADIDNHRSKGMANAMKRLNKDYLVERESGSADIYIRFHFFMEAKNDTNGGKHKAMVNIVKNYNVANNDSGAWMSSTTSQLRQRDYQDDPNYFTTNDPVNKKADTDGQTYSVLTNSHEMGHATGCWDHYLYDLQDTLGRGWSRLPRINQPFTAEGGPFSGDDLARMNVNRTPRIRSYWKYVCWLNDMSKSGMPLNKFLDSTLFKITFKAKTFTHQFKLKDEYKNTSKPCKEIRNFQLAPKIKTDLLLYKLGDDEYSRLLKPNIQFNGILVVRSKIAFCFRDDPANAANTWKLQNKIDIAYKWSRELNIQINQFQKMFYLSTNSQNDFQNVLLFVSPSYDLYGCAGGAANAPADIHFKIVATFRLGNNFRISGNTLSVDYDTNKARIASYILGKTASPYTIGTSDFPEIVKWINKPTIGNASYQVKTL